MEDRRAHERIDSLENVFAKHLEDHVKIQDSIVENTAMTKEIANNTKELVALVKGAKGFRTFILWAAPIAAWFAAAWAWIKTH